MGSSISRGAKSKNDVFGLLPEEIVRGEILTRLPVKSVVRFRCVCKSWQYLLTSDHDFVKSHLTRYSMDPNNSSLIVRCFRFPRNNIQNYKSHPLKSRNLALGGSVNGLVCVYHYVSRSIAYLGVWNPATNQYKDIPPPSRATNISTIYDFNLGFGFDPIANDYKVVYISVTTDCPLVADVYSCNDDSWGKNSVISTFLSRGIHCPRPTILNGCPYWYNSNVKYPEHYYVMFFDIKDEVFRLLPGIEYVHDPAQNRIMVNLRDSLAFIVEDVPKSTSRSVYVYIFDQSCGLWSKNYTVGPLTMPKGMYFFNCFSNGDFLFYSGTHLQLLSVNHETHAIDMLKSDIYVYDNSRYNLFGLYSFSYNESLVSVKGMNLMHVREVGTDVLIIERSS